MNKAFFISLLFLSLVACKKKEEPDTDPSGTPINNVTPNDSTSYNALFSCLNTYAKLSGTYTPIGRTTAAYYSNQYVINESYIANTLQDIGTVSLNGVIFKDKTAFANYYFTDTTATQFTLPHNWLIGGTAAINTFSYSNMNTPPTFTAAANIPDSIKLSNGFSIKIKGTEDCSLVRVFVLGGSGSTTFPNKLISGTDTMITFTSGDLQGITTTTAGYMSIQFSRDHYRTIGGKRINFRTGLLYYNSALKIKP